MALVDMDLDQTMQFIALTDGRPFRVEFIKRTTAELRVMNASIKAPEHAIKALSGKGKAFDAAARGLITVWDCDKEEWRHIPTEGITRIHTASGWVPVKQDAVPDEPQQ